MIHYLAAGFALAFNLALLLVVAHLSARIRRLRDDPLAGLPELAGEAPGDRETRARMAASYREHALQEAENGYVSDASKFLDAAAKLDPAKDAALSVRDAVLEERETCAKLGDEIERDGRAEAASIRRNLAGLIGPAAHAAERRADEREMRADGAAQVATNIRARSGS